MQGFSNFFIPNLATVHLQARGHSPQQARAAASVSQHPRKQPTQPACTSCGLAPARPAASPASHHPSSGTTARLRRPVRPHSPTSQHPCKRGHRGCSPCRHRSLRGHARRSLRGRAAGPPCRPPSLSQRASCSRRGSRLALASISAPDADSAAPQPPLPPVRAPPIRNGLALAARALRALAARARGTEKLDRWGWVGWRGGPDWFGLAGWVG